MRSKTFALEVHPQLQSVNAQYSNSLHQQAKGFLPEKSNVDWSKMRFRESNGLKSWNPRGSSSWDLDFEIILDNHAVKQ